MFRATYFVTFMVEAPIAGSTFQEALTAAQQKESRDLVKMKPGVENIDWRIQLYSVADVAVNGGL